MTTSFEFEIVWHGRFPQTQIKSFRNLFTPGFTLISLKTNLQAANQVASPLFTSDINLPMTNKQTWLALAGLCIV